MRNKVLKNTLIDKDRDNARKNRRKSDEKGGKNYTKKNNKKNMVLVQQTRMAQETRT